MDNDALQEKVFALQNNLKFKIKSLKLKLSQDQSIAMLQFINVTECIKLKETKQENRFLSMTNAFVSHELRNPLQSIVA